MSDNFIMFYNFILFYNFIRRRWINSFLTFDKFSIFDNLFFMSHSRLHYLNPLPLSSLSQPYPLSALNTLHSILSPQTIVNKKGCLPSR